MGEMPDFSEMHDRVLGKANRTIDDYIDLAKARVQIKSDRQFGLRINAGPTAISNYRTKRAWPSDATMWIIAELAGLPHVEALIDLNIWRSSHNEVADAYRLAKKAMNMALRSMGKTPFVLALAFFASVLAAGTPPAQAATGAGAVYIMENLRRWLRGRRRRWKAA